MSEGGAANAAGSQGASIIYTPTYYIAAVFLVLVVVSFAIDRTFQLLDKFFVKKKRRDLAEVLRRVRDELMLLGFISLLLSLCGPAISNICVTDAVDTKFLMCPYPNSEAETSEDPKAPESEVLSTPISDFQSNESLRSPPTSQSAKANQTAELEKSLPHARGLLGYEQPLLQRLPSSLHYTSTTTTASHSLSKAQMRVTPRRLLRHHSDEGILPEYANALLPFHHGRSLLGGSSQSESTCPAGMQPFIPLEGLHQLHLFIFIVTLMHIVCSWLVVFLSLLRLRLWRRCEEAAQKACKTMTRRSLSQALRDTLDVTTPASYAARQLRPISVILPSPAAMAASARWTPRAVSHSVHTPRMAMSFQMLRKPSSSRFPVAGVPPKAASAAFLSPRPAEQHGAGRRSTVFGVCDSSACASAGAGAGADAVAGAGASASAGAGEGTAATAAAATAVVEDCSAGGATAVSGTVFLFAAGPRAGDSKGPMPLVLQTSKSDEVARKTVRFVDVDRPSKSMPHDVTARHASCLLPGGPVRRLQDEAGGNVERVMADVDRSVGEGGESVGAGWMALSNVLMDCSPPCSGLAAKRVDGVPGRKEDGALGGERHALQDITSGAVKDSDVHDEVRRNDARNRWNEVDVHAERDGEGKGLGKDNECDDEGEEDDDEGEEEDDEGEEDDDGGERNGSNTLEGEVQGKTRLPIRLILSLTFSSVFLQLGAVAQEDYNTMRMAFIHNHRLSPRFDFHAFLVRSMGMDFLSVVGTAWYIWLYVIVTILFDIYGWNEQFWLSFVPLIMALVIGTKLKYITAKLAFDSQGDGEGLGSGHQHRHQHLMRLRNSLFWFHRPQFLLRLLHIMLFMNSFCLAQVTFDAIVFSLAKCSAGNHHPYWQYIVLVPVSVFTLFWCSFVTLPLYALVTNMGSNPKAAMFNEEVLEKLKWWRKRAQKRRVVDFRGVLKKVRCHKD